MKYILLIITLFVLNIKAEDNTFRVVTYKYVKHEGSHDGSGFYYSNTRLFTAAHLFRKNDTECWIIKNEQKIKCKVLKIDFNLDVCVLESEPNDTWYTIKDLQVVGIGFPTDNKVENSGAISKFESNNQTIPGMSGGPLIEKGTDQCYGIIVKNGLFGNTSVCKIVPGNKLLEFIKDIK